MDESKGYFVAADSRFFKGGGILINLVVMHVTGYRCMWKRARRWLNEVHNLPPSSCGATASTRKHRHCPVSARVHLILRRKDPHRKGAFDSSENS